MLLQPADGDAVGVYGGCRYDKRTAVVAGDGCRYDKRTAVVAGDVRL